MALLSRCCFTTCNEKSECKTIEEIFICNQLLVRYNWSVGVIYLVYNACIKGPGPSLKWTIIKESKCTLGEKEQEKASLQIDNMTDTNPLQGLPDDYVIKSQAFTKQVHRDVYPAIDPSNPALSQKGKVVIITGASKGIGRKVWEPHHDYHKLSLIVR